MKTDKKNKFGQTAHLLCCALVFLFSASAPRAATLPEYRAKIQAAKQFADVLLYAPVEKTNIAENLATGREMLRQIRANIPSTEKIEFENASFQAENGWLLDKLKNFENEKDSAKRRTILAELSERLAILETRLNELEKQESLSRTKDEDKQKLAEILGRAEYQKPEVKNETFFQRLWREFWEWLKSIFPKSAPTAPSQSGFQTLSLVLQFALFAFVFAALGFLIYRFAPFLKERFRRREKKDNPARVILGERLAADATSENLFSEAEHLAREGNLRAAIRKGYIALLCELSDRKIIGLARHKTNRDYLRDVSRNENLHQNMKALTGSFENVWYGFAHPEEKDWEEFRRKYKQAVSGSR